MEQQHPSETTLATLAVMRQQEAAYTAPPIPYDAGTVIDTTARTAMRQWFVRLMDFLQVNHAEQEALGGTTHTAARDVVPIALNFVDRYVAVHHGVLQDRAWYQRLSMTALYTALKLHGSAQHAMLDPSAICRLSMDTFSVAEIEAQELELVQTLQWRLNPPTAVQFVRQFVMLIPVQLPHEEDRMQERVEEMALESITRRLRGGCEPHLIHLRPSQVAWNAVQESLVSCCILGGRDNGQDETLEATIAHVLSCSGFDLGQDSSSNNNNNNSNLMQRHRTDPALEEQPQSQVNLPVRAARRFMKRRPSPRSVVTSVESPC